MRRVSLSSLRFFSRFLKPVCPVVWSDDADPSPPIVRATAPAEAEIAVTAIPEVTATAAPPSAAAGGPTTTYTTYTIPAPQAQATTTTYTIPPPGAPMPPVNLSNLGRCESSTDLSPILFPSLPLLTIGLCPALGRILPFAYDAQELGPHPVPVLQTKHPDHPHRGNRLFHDRYVHRAAAHLLASVLVAVCPTGMQEHQPLVRVVRAQDWGHPRLQRLLQVILWTVIETTPSPVHHQIHRNKSLAAPTSRRRCCEGSEAWKSSIRWFVSVSSRIPTHSDAFLVTVHCLVGVQ